MSLDIPEEHDAESYAAGYAAAMRHIGQHALAGATELSPEDYPTDSDASATRGVTDDGDDDTCSECGARLLASMGAAETTTPAGMICPECEL